MFLSDFNRLHNNDMKSDAQENIGKWKPIQEDQNGAKNRTQQHTPHVQAAEREEEFSVATEKVQGRKPN